MIACTIGSAEAEKAVELLLAHGASPNGCAQVIIIIDALSTVCY